MLMCKWVRRAKHVQAVRRGVIRFLVLVVDCSENMNQRDMRPMRLSCAHQVVSEFIENYFDQNPISQLALIELRSGGATKVTELSGNARHHKNKLDQRMQDRKFLGEGMPSLRAGLELAYTQLEMQASYGTREVLILYGSLSTSDRGDIFKTVEKLRDKKVKVSIVGVGAELYVAKAMCEKTGGNYWVAREAMEMRSKVRVCVHLSRLPSLPPPCLTSLLHSLPSTPSVFFSCP